MNVLDLFSGIGGFSLGLERAGMRTVAFCEVDPFCRAVLRKHWPDVPCYDDVRTLTGERLRADGIVPDVICGGFPCQDISTAGKGAGIEGERSGLWSEYARIIGEVRPRFVIVENVAVLLSRGLAKVLGDLAALGLDAEWHCIPASTVGAPHRRDRVWIVAYPGCERGAIRRNARDMASATGAVEADGEQRERLWHASSDGGSTMADAISPGCSRARSTQSERRQRDPVPSRRGEDVANAECWRLQSRDVERAGETTIIPAALSRHLRGVEFGAPWRTEPNVGRVAYGVPDQVDRLSSLGNAVVPQIPEIIGRAIMNRRADGANAKEANNV